MKRKVLITGGYGFLGRHCTQYFNLEGFEVHGIGHGQYTTKGINSKEFGEWHEKAITKENLLNIGSGFETVIHCAGGSSVTKSFQYPENDYTSTVATTLEILEYIRLYSPKTRLIFPSSAAVYGESVAARNSINSELNPSSPYGIHKKIAEDLCLSYHQFFDIDVSIIRFFSIYGPGLRKQLIWDACNKLSSVESDSHVDFWGTGEETRDWLYSSEAVDLIYSVSVANNPPRILNGGTGSSVSIKDVLFTLAELFGLSKENIQFKGDPKMGDPSHFLADLRETNTLGWKPSVCLKNGLTEYLDWFKAIKK